MYKKNLLSTMVLSAIFFSGCGGSSNEGVNNVGSNLISATVIDDINASTMLSIVKAKIDPNALNAFGYKAIKIVYKTKGQNDEDINASGLLVIPSATKEYNDYRVSQGQSQFSISMICDNHGTIFANDEAPSNVEVENGMPDYSVAVAATGYAGFALVAPDYIGYGESNGTVHPYMLEKASARASLDMINAAQRYMTDNNILFNGQLFISGYSQGGYTAMALAKEIEQNHSNQYKIMGLAPMAGPYDLKALADIELDANHTMVYPAFLADLGNGYANYYNNDITLDTILASNIDKTTFPTLFNGDYNEYEIHAALGFTENLGFNTYKANKLFQDNFINDYQNNANNIFKEKLEENSVYNWTPRTKINLIHCSDDEIIPFSMSQTAYDTFLANGVDSSNITLTTLPTAILSQQQDLTHPFVHANCAKEAYGVALDWFNKIRIGEIK